MYAIVSATNAGIYLEETFGISFEFLGPSFWLVVTGQFSFCSTFVMLLVGARLKKFDPVLEEAALSLRATKLQVIWLIIIPFLRPAIIGAFVVAFLISFSNFNTTIFLVGSDPTLPVMTPGDRQARIANIIRQRHRVTVNELAEILNISRETIRRDLSELDRLGKVHKIHGGASLPITIGEGSFRIRMGENVAAKVQVAAEAVKLFSSGETILIDTGSTTVYFAEKLVELSDLTIVTNSSEIARIVSLSPNNPRVFLLGGQFNGDNRQTFGNFAISQLGLFRAHHVILTIGALDAKTGVMDFSIEEAQLAQAMIAQADSLTIIADSSKFERIASFKVCDLDQVKNLVCDQYPSEEITAALKEANVNIFCVDCKK